MAHETVIRILLRCKVGKDAFFPSSRCRSSVLILMTPHMFLREYTVVFRLHAELGLCVEPRGSEAGRTQYRMHSDYLNPHSRSLARSLARSLSLSLAQSCCFSLSLCLRLPPALRLPSGHGSVSLHACPCNGRISASSLQRYQAPSSLWQHIKKPAWTWVHIARLWGVLCAPFNKSKHSGSRTLMWCSALMATSGSLKYLFIAGLGLSTETTLPCRNQRPRLRYAIMLIRRARVGVWHMREPCRGRHIMTVGSMYVLLRYLAPVGLAHRGLRCRGR